MINNRNAFLKVIGLVSMTFDHIGMLLFPHAFWLRVLGRIAFPIFAYHVALGVRQTRSLSRYALRVGICGCITQPIYLLVVGSGLNVMVDLFVGIIVLGLIKAGEKKEFVLAIAVALAWAIWNQGYGIYGTACIVAFYYMSQKETAAVIFFILIQIIASFSSPNCVQGFAVLALPFILLNPSVIISVPQYFFYLYYPLHLLVLYFVNIKFF